MSYKRLAKYCVILSVITMYNRLFFLWAIKPDVFFILGGALFIYIALVKKELVINWKNIFPIYKILAVSVIAIVVGSIMSFILYHNLPWKDILVGFKILIGCVLVFTEIIILGYQDTKFLSHVVFSFLALLVLIIVPYLPWQSVHSFFGSDLHRFNGFVGEANYFPTLMILPILTIFYFLTKDSLSQKNMLRKLSFFIIFSLSIGLVISSGSRGGWLGLSAGILTLILIMSKNSQKKVAKFFILTIIAISATTFGLFLMPQNVKSDIGNRVQLITGSNPKTKITPILVLNSLDRGKDRLNIGKQSLDYIIKNPLGYGISYQNILNIKIESLSQNFGSHSLILQLFLVGGIGLFVSFFYLIWKVVISFIRNQYKNKKLDLESVLFSSLVGLFVCSLFMESLLLRWFWIQLAIIIAWQVSKQNNPTHNFTGDNSLNIKS